MPVGVIDIGTNSVVLLITESPAQSALFETAEITQLGKGAQSAVTDECYIQRDAIERTCAVLERYQQICDSWQATPRLAYGTAILRHAHNRDAVLDEIRRRTGLRVRVLTAEEEARFAYLSVRQDPFFCEQGPEHWGVLDVGGGSTEWVTGATEVTGLKCLRIGASTVAERYLRHDPPTSDEIRSARQRIRAELADLEPLDLERTVVVGIGGTLVNLAGMATGISVPDPRLHGIRLSRCQLDTLIPSLASLSQEERRRLPGLEPKRADTILGGAFIVQGVLESLAIPSLYISIRGTRHGVAAYPWLKH